jgi:hypothetical protein
MEQKKTPEKNPAFDETDPRISWIRREQVRDGVQGMLNNLREMIMIYLEQFPPAKQLEIIHSGSLSIETMEDGGYFVGLLRLRRDFPAMPLPAVEKFGRADYISFDALALRIPPDEPVFVFRAQDDLTPEIAEFYAGRLQQKGGDAYLVNLAIQHANRIRDWQEKNDTKTADYSEEGKKADEIR